MDGTDRKRFHYHASAHVLSGEVRRPFQHVIGAQAPSVLPSTGGVGKSRVDNFRLDDLVSFKAGYTHVLGSKQREIGVGGEERIVHTTQVTATVEGLNILDVVTADRIVARLTSHHDPDPEEGHIGLIGSKFENLRIAGCEVHVKLHHELFLNLDSFAEAKSKLTNQTDAAIRAKLEKDKLDKAKLEEATGASVTEEEIKKELAERAQFQRIAKETLQTVHRDPKLELKQPQGHEALLCSLVEKIEFKNCCVEETCAGVTLHGGHAFHVRDFGTVFLAEVLFEHGRKTLTMMRVELGSPCDAGMTIIEASSNGRKYPPTP